MPLAFLISAFCRPLSASERDRAIADADSAARSATRNIRGGNIHTSCRTGFSIFPSVFLSVSPAVSRQELFGAETWRVARNYEKHATGITITSLYHRYSCPQLNLSYFQADNKITIDFVYRCNYLICDTILSQICIFCPSPSTLLHCICIGYKILRMYKIINPLALHIIFKKCRFNVDLIKNNK